MVDTRYPISGSIRYWLVQASGLNRWDAPTDTEVNAGLDISDSISWNDKDFGVQSSNTTSDPAITAKGNVQSRGAAQYGGSLSLYYGKDFDDLDNAHSVAFQALRLPGTVWYIVSRVDGLELASPTGTAAQPGTKAAAGDIVSVFRVETAGYAESITGEEAFRYTVSFLPKGQVKTMAIVRSSATPALPVVSGPSTGTVTGGPLLLEGTLEGRKYTRGLRWTTTTPSIATVSRNGVVTPRSIGTASIVATDPATGAQSTAKSITLT